MNQPSQFLVFWLLIILMFYFLLIRPQQAQARRRREMLSGLREGDRVLTVGGLYATIQKIKEDELTLELAPNVTVKADRGAVQVVRGRQQAKATP